MFNPKSANNNRDLANALISLFLIIVCYRTANGVSIAHNAACNASIFVTVDGSGSEARDCSAEKGSLTNLTCTCLQDVLLSVSDNRTISGDTGQSVSGIIVRVLPGDYVLSQSISIVNQSVTLWGDGEGVRITFSFLESGFQPNSPFYVLSFIHCHVIQMYNLVFNDSPGPITAVNVDSVHIKGCSFSNFLEGAVDAYNCHSVTVRDSIFEHNGPVMMEKSEPYRGHSGGLSIGYFGEASTDSPKSGPVAFVSNCTFRNNTSDPRALDVQSATDLLQRFAFTGRGGGCAFTVFSPSSLNATIENCTLEDNLALTAGGGLYVEFDGNQNHTVAVNRVRFVRNVCRLAGGGLVVGFLQGAALQSLNRILVYNSEFTENQAMFGGGIYYISLGPTDPEGRLSNFGRFQNCTFMGNVAREYGAAIGVFTLLHFQDMVNILPLEIDSCVFSGNNNGGGGGILSTAYLPLKFSGKTVFEHNRGRGLVIIGALIEIHGGLHFNYNDGAGIDGGAMYIASYGQLKLFNGANITFTGNTGVIGAGIVVDNPLVSTVAYSHLGFNTLCTLLYEDDTLAPAEWANVSLRFSGNSAVIASAVHLSNLDLCAWVKKPPFFAPSGVFRWHFVEFSETNQNTAHEPDDFNQEWSVQTSATDIRLTSDATVSAYPGEPFSLGIQVLDEISRPTSDILRISDLSNDIEDVYLLRPSVITLNQIALASVNTSFLSATNFEYGSSKQLHVETLLGSSSSFTDAELQSRRCPPGYALKDSPFSQRFYKTCDCDTSNRDILECNGADILISTGLWATEDSSSSGDSIVMYPCPTGYCRCLPTSHRNSSECHFVFSSKEPDTQCSCGRQGELCGDCTGGKPVSVLFNKCTSCSDANTMLIPLLAVLDAVVFIALLVIMKPLPEWAYPCIFYLQILPYLTDHFPATFDQIRAPLYYVGSGLSFYFVYDFCVYNEMGPFLSYLLRYLPLLVAVVVSSAMLVLRRCLQKHAVPWHGLWWMVLLLYTHVLHTSVSILNCPALPGRDGANVPRWYVNGNIKCFSGDHTYLGLLAIVILGLCVSVIPLSLVYIMGWLQRPWIFRRLFGPVSLPFTEQYKWWACVELSRRALLVLFIVSFPQNEYPATFLLMVLISLYGYMQPFRDKLINILEVVIAIDTIILLLLRRTHTVTDVLGRITVTDSSVNETSRVDDCSDYTADTVTGVTWLLLPFYYLPLVISCLVAVVWVGLQIKSVAGAKCCASRQEDADPLFENIVITSSSLEVTNLMNLGKNADGDGIPYTELCDEAV